MAVPELFAYQRKVLTLVAERFGHRALLALDMGLGKTAIALCWLARHRFWPAVVVCPASVKYQWAAEARRWIGVDPMVLEGRTPAGCLDYYRLTIVNYDILADHLPSLMMPTAVVIDESQYIANHRTKRSKAVQQLCRRVPCILALSGTPLLNRPIELFSTLQILRPRIFRSRWKYAHEFCAPKRTFWGWDFRGASNTAKLKQLLRSTCAIRIRKDQVLSQLPPKMREVVPLPLSDPDEYRAANTDFLSWLRQNDPSRLRSAKRAEALVKLNCLLQLCAKLKLPAVCEWIESCLESESKLVVFATHRAMLREMQQRCRWRNVLVDGSVRGKHRTAAVEKFQTDPTVRLFFGNILAAGIGINLTAASAVAIVELPWRPGDCVQAEDRLHRIGTQRPVWCYYLVAHGTVEERLCRLLQRKQRVISAVLDGRGGEGLPLFDQLLEELRNEPRAETAGGGFGFAADAIAGANIGAGGGD